MSDSSPGDLAGDLEFDEAHAGADVGTPPDQDADDARPAFEDPSER